MKKKVIIWGMGRDYEELRLLFKYYEMIEDLSVIGITSDINDYSHLDGYQFFEKKEIVKLPFDYLIICSRAFYHSIKQEACQLGISDEKILSAFALQIPGFEIERYMRLKNLRITILANNCWGGATYSKLNWEFLSPLINTYVPPDSFLRLISDFKRYISKPLKFRRSSSEYLDNAVYPVYNLGGDVEIYMPHAVDLDQEEQKWEERVKKINYDNIFVCMCTENIEEAEKFELLPYTRKICFVPFQTTLASCLTIRTHECRSPHMYIDATWFTAFENAVGIYKEYDVLNILEGRISHSVRTNVIGQGE